MKNDKKEGKRLALLLIASLSVIVLIFCVVKLTIYKLSSFKATKDVKELEEKIDSSKADKNSNPDDYQESAQAGTVNGTDKELKVLDKYANLYKQNKDFAGWIKIDGTNISYPVMMNSSDAEYYLHRNFDGESSDEGLPFIDNRCSIKKPSNNIIIYGHNMKNGDMFADLLKYDSKKYYETHSTVKFDSLYYEGEYHIISVLRADVSKDSDDEFRFYEFTDETYPGEFSAYLRDAKEASLYEIPFDASKVTELITLSTCEYTKKDGRFVIIAAKYADI